VDTIHFSGNPPGSNYWQGVKQAELHPTVPSLSVLPTRSQMQLLSDENIAREMICRVSLVISASMSTTVFGARSWRHDAPMFPPLLSAARQKTFSERGGQNP
jgi:hypothetical protein